MATTRTPYKATLSGAPLTWTNQPAALTELAGTLDRRVKLDLTDADKVRLCVRVGVAGSASAIVKAQYSTDESVWNDLTGTVDIASTGTKASAWGDVPAAAKADVFVRIVGTSSNSTGDPQFGLMVLEVR